MWPGYEDHPKSMWEKICGLLQVIKIEGTSTH